VLGPGRSAGAATERQQLLFLGLGLVIVAGAIGWLVGPHALHVVLVSMAAVALAGFVAHRAIGRGVFLVFFLLSSAIARLVSWLIVLVLYVTVIGGLGVLLRLVGMNRLERNYPACKRKHTMFVDVPPLDPAGFRRQS
jgi:ABC-type sugar transport system permease subunit